MIPPRRGRVKAAAGLQEDSATVRVGGVLYNVATAVGESTGWRVLLLVPVAVCGSGIEADSVMHYSERLAPGGKLGFLKGDELVKRVLGL